MPTEHGDALEFFEDVVGDDDPHAEPDPEREFELEAANGRVVVMGLVPCDRKFVIDQLNKLPDELLDLLSEVDDPEEAQARADEANALTGLSGQAIDAFEQLCAKGMQHEEYTEHHYKRLVKELDLEILFEMGSMIIEMSLEDTGKITGFREVE